MSKYIVEAPYLEPGLREFTFRLLCDDAAEAFDVAEHLLKSPGKYGPPSIRIAEDGADRAIFVSGSS